MHPQTLPWCDPLDLAYSLGDGPLVLLYSSARTGYSGRRSLLACGLLEQAEFDDFAALDTLLAQGGHDWFGYLGYEMRHDCERYSRAAQQGYGLPRARLMRFSHLYEFDHERHTLTLKTAGDRTLPPLRTMPDIAPPAVRGLSSNMTRGEYESKVESILESIRRGDLYQANLTRKFYGTWDEPPEGLALFARLCRTSPAPYSAYLRMPDAEILSSSPELFLRLGTDGTIETRPIKGSAPRGKNEREDRAIRAALEASAKNRAENLMIADLMRHDLARSAVAGSVRAHGLFEVTDHAHIFHMASTITARRAPGATVGGILRGCFPPGSMTGAPKIRAVEMCSALEGIERGVYSGALGWFGAKGDAELSVVIRTLIIRETAFEFQVGGGIVADSTAGGEWAETIDKAMGILKTLGIERERLERL